MRNNRVHRFALWTCLLLLPAVCFAASVTICPHQINLNAVGAFDDVQAVVRTPMPSGYAIADFDVELWLDGRYVMNAKGVVYCYTDANFLVSFDRDELQANPVVRSLAGQTVTAEVDGVVFVENADGDVRTVTLSGSDQVTILTPGKK